MKTLIIFAIMYLIVYFVLRSKYDTYIKLYSKKYNVPSGIIKAVIRVESNFRADAIGQDKEIGLMQVMPSTAKGEFGINEYELALPHVNIETGTRYLEKQFNRYGDWSKAISAYNAGHFTTINKSYVNKVMVWNIVYSAFPIFVSIPNVPDLPVL